MWGSHDERRAFGRLWPSWYGPTETRNRRRAVQALRPLADAGYAPAQFALAQALFDGGGVRRDYVQAFEHFRAAAEHGFPAAQNMVGAMCATVNPKYGACRHDPVEAARWFRLAAKSGNAGAQCNLASVCRSGLGLERDPAGAYVWASLSVHCSAPLRNRMAESIRDQVAGELDPEQRKAADLRIAELSRELPHPWSEPMIYWRLLAEQAGAV